MNFQEISTLAYRIMQGKMYYEFLNKKYILIAPTLNIVVDAQYYYNSIIDECKFEEWLPKDKIERILTYNGLWQEENNEKINILNKKIEDCKVDIFKSFFNSVALDQYKLNLKTIQKEVDKLEDIKHSLDYITIEGLAIILQHYYILAHTLYYTDNTLVFNDFYSTNFSLLQIIYSNLQDYSISIEQYREIARSEPWLQYWRTGKNNIFGKNGVQLTTDQRYLILYSQMYDSIYEHSESPCQEIIDDDDALDGWLIEQRRKRESENKEKNTKNVLNIHPNAQDIFLPARSQQDIERIEGMNSGSSKIIKAQRTNVIHKKGEVSESQLPDRKVEISQLILEQQRRR